MTLGDFLWSLLAIYAIFFYFMILFRVIGDLFSDPDAGGLAKTVWLIALLVLPFLSLFIYLIIRGKDMTHRATARAAEMNAAQRDYIRQVAGTPDDATTKIEKAHNLFDAGAISAAEFDTLKAQALA